LNEQETTNFPPVVCLALCLSPKPNYIIKLVERNEIFE